MTAYATFETEVAGRRAELSIPRLEPALAELYQERILAELKLAFTDAVKKTMRSGEAPPTPFVATFGFCSGGQAHKLTGFARFVGGKPGGEPARA